MTHCKLTLVENAYGRPRFFSPDWELNAGPDGIEGTADDGTASLFGNTTLFTGREFDAETGLFFYRARYFSPDLGRFLARDPLQADINLYRYCRNRPKSLGDPFGLYEIEWEGDWPDRYKKKIMDSFDRIAKHVDRLLREIENEQKGLSPCMRCHLDGELNKLKAVLQGVKNGIASTSDNLELYHYDFGKDETDANSKAGGLWWDAEIRFNDGVQPPKWYDKPESMLDELLFHELTHLYGTVDDDSAGELMNAHTIDGMINGSVTGNPIYAFLKRKAAEKCRF